MRKDLDLSIDRDEWEPTVAGRRLRFLEMSSAELTRYAERLESQYERAVAIMAERPEMGLNEVAELVLEREDDFFLWLCNLHTPASREVGLDWIRDELTCGMRRRLLANVDRLNHVGEQVGNWTGLRQEAIARRVGLSLPTLLEPVTESTPGPSDLTGPPDKP
jgi:hypothetical protein